jgi:hypothetical protein
LADLYFDTNQYDSAFLYATKALKYPSTFFNQRDCYRILANTQYLRNDIKQTAFFMAKYQDCSDSVRKVETQTKTTVLEDIHSASQTASKTKQYLIVLAWVIPVIIIISLLIVMRLRKRNKGKEIELHEAEVQINKKQSLLITNLQLKIQETRDQQAFAYKKASPAQRTQMDKELYIASLHTNDWPVFKKLMNSTFNNMIDVLEKTYPDVTTKEMTWACLTLLDITTPDIALILDSQPGSMYKLKQRLTQKLQLKSTKELDQLIQNIACGK